MEFKEIQEKSSNFMEFKRHITRRFFFFFFEYALFIVTSEDAYNDKWIIKRKRKRNKNKNKMSNILVEGRGQVVIKQDYSFIWDWSLWTVSIGLNKIHDLQSSSLSVSVRKSDQHLMFLTLLLLRTCSLLIRPNRKYH